MHVIFLWYFIFSIIGWFQKISIPPPWKLFSFCLNLPSPLEFPIKLHTFPYEFWMLRLPTHLKNFQWPSMGWVWIFPGSTHCIKQIIKTTTFSSGLHAVFSPGRSFAGFPQEKLRWPIKAKKMRPLGCRDKLWVKRKLEHVRFNKLF